MLPQLAFLGLGARVTQEWLEQVTLIAELRSASMGWEENGSVGKALVTLHAQWEEQLLRVQRQQQQLEVEEKLQLRQQHQHESLEELKQQARQREGKWWARKRRQQQQEQQQEKLQPQESPVAGMISLLSMVETWQRNQQTAIAAATGSPGLAVAAGGRAGRVDDGALQPEEGKGGGGGRGGRIIESIKPPYAILATPAI